MIKIRKSKDRGHADHGWLDTRHTFSFADYYDLRHMGFHALRVINEDRIAPGLGFDSHPHRDMEIVTCVLEGSLRHEDSLGNGSVILPGEVQRMSAGTGVVHSERNSSTQEICHLLQIWILPNRKGITPSYEQKKFPLEEGRSYFQLVGSQDGRNGSVTIHQDVSLYQGQLESGEEVVHALTPGRHAWIQVITGPLAVNKTSLEAGDGAAIEKETELRFKGSAGARFLLFDLA